jgi:chromosome segregation ATPase
VALISIQAYIDQLERERDQAKTRLDKEQVEMNAVLQELADVNKQIEDHNASKSALKGDDFISGRIVLEQLQAKQRNLSNQHFELSATIEHRTAALSNLEKELVGEMTRLKQCADALKATEAEKAEKA